MKESYDGIPSEMLKKCRFLRKYLELSQICPIFAASHFMVSPFSRNNKEVDCVLQTTSIFFAYK